MSTLQEFAKNFGDKPIPEALARLWEFQEKTGFEYYADGFGLQYDDKGGLENGWSNNPAFLEKLMPFAQANGGGSFYALWQYDGAVSLDQLPVVLFGDEGGEFIVAENINGLLQLLTLDSEPMTYEEVSFYRDPEEDSTEFSEAYITWLKKTLNLDAIEEASDVIEPAQEKFQVVFDSWKNNYLR